jgi:hypothetical protein
MDCSTGMATILPPGHPGPPPDPAAWPTARFAAEDAGRRGGRGCQSVPADDWPPWQILDVGTLRDVTERTPDDRDQPGTNPLKPAPKTKPDQRKLWCPRQESNLRPRD